MKNNFAQMITILRNQRGLSQKVAAQKLGISQGLLSHYEKGIRECGLDFVIKAAEFYGVSCGYLLGAETDLSENKRIENKLSKRSSRVVNSILDLNEIATEIGGEGLCNKVNDIMSVHIYNTLRAIDSNNDSDLFEMDLAHSIIKSSAFLNNSSAKLHHSEFDQTLADFEIHKDTQKLIKVVEQRLETV